MVKQKWIALCTIIFFSILQGAIEKPGKWNNFVLININFS